MAPITINGRHVQHAGVSFVGTHISSITCDHESVCIRFDHETNSEFWFELRVHSAELASWYECIGHTDADVTTHIYPPAFDRAEVEKRLDEVTGNEFHGPGSLVMFREKPHGQGKPESDS